MEFNGNLRNPMEIHRIQWKFKKSNGNSWKFLEIHKHPVEIHRIRWKSTESAGNPWNSVEIHGIQWKSMETYRNPWNPMEIHRIRWKSMEFYGNLRNPVEFRIQTNRNSDKIGTQTQSELRQNRDTFKITKGRWEKKNFRLSPYIYNK